MTPLDEAVLRLLTAKWETAAALIQDLRNEPRYKGEWTPGAVLESLERLAVAGKAEFDLAKGWRLMPDRPPDPDRQKGLWQ